MSTSGPAGAVRPVRTSRVFTGIGLVLLADLVVIGLPLLVGTIVAKSDRDGAVTLVMLGLELVLLIGGLALGLAQITKGDKGIGVGLLIGWAVSILAVPVIGAGLCISMIDSGSY